MKKKTVSSLKKKLDTVFSKYIRMRDAMITTGTITRAKCCTCGKEQDIRYMDAGHWRSRKFNTTRFDERNVHIQCKGCNGFGNGMQEEYRRFLTDAYGEDTVDELYLLSKQTKQFNISELEELINYYKKEIKFLMEQYE